MNITKATEDYINKNPYIKNCLLEDMINYSKLARVIQAELKVKNFDAILVAIRRYMFKLKSSYDRKDILNILKLSKVQIRNKIIVVIVDPRARVKDIRELERMVDDTNEIMHVISGPNAITLITTEDMEAMIREKLGRNIIKVTENLVEITLKSPKKLEQVPGVLGFLYSLIGENDVNIVETMSCWTDTILVISEKDLSKTMEMLKF